MSIQDSLWKLILIKRLSNLTGNEDLVIYTIHTFQLEILKFYNYLKERAGELSKLTWMGLFLLMSTFMLEKKTQKTFEFFISFLQWSSTEEFWLDLTIKILLWLPNLVTLTEINETQCLHVDVMWWNVFILLQCLHSDC